MPPYPKDVMEPTGKRFNGEDALEYSQGTKAKGLEIVWINVVVIFLLHVLSIYALYLTFASAKLYTVIFTNVIYQLTVLGVTGGAHRLWSHRSYKATMPLKLLLLYCHTMAHQQSVITWVKDHRMHHKYDGTNADPHNIKRGFFFAHMGWVMCKKHEEVKIKGKGLDLSDLYSDPLIRFQHKYHGPLTTITCFIIPTMLPMIFWNETFKNAFFLNIFRYTVGLNSSGIVNSLAHWWGDKPYDKSISATQNAMYNILTGGEGWHNYHHIFPWDFRASEFGTLNLTMHWIRLFEKIGWAYDLKSAPEEMIKRKMERSGDGKYYKK